MVWCYEKAHKRESMENRATLTAVAQRSGGFFRSFKKAKQFDKWSLTQTKPFILCTDWREAKPCLQTMTLQGQQNRALFTILVCATERQRGRAESWLCKLNQRRDPVHIVDDFCSIESMVPSLLPQALQAMDSFSNALCSHDGDVQMQVLQPTRESALMQPTVACTTTLSTRQDIKLEEAIRTENAQVLLATEGQPKCAGNQCNVFFQHTQCRQYGVQAPQMFSHQLNHAPLTKFMLQTCPPTLMVPTLLFVQY